MKIDFTYLLQPPKKYTFEQPKLKKWIENWSMGKVLNFFAGKVKLDLDEIRNDINPNMPADYHIDAYDFIINWEGEKFDTIILDPPYNLRKAREKYNNIFTSSLRKIKTEIPKILNPNGRIISLGYDSVGMGRKRGFLKIAICLICHGGDHNDTIGLVEKMAQLKLW